MFEFLEENVPTRTTDEVRKALERRVGCMVRGATGTGKSHAVREAVNGAVWVNLDSGRDQVPRFLVDVARQVHGGSAMLERLVEQRLDEALEHASELLGSRCLVVDRAERLVRKVDRSWDLSWDDPLHTLSAAQNEELAHWLSTRSRTPTVLVSRYGLPGWPEWDARVVHQPPTSWPLKLQQASGGFRDWKRLTELIRERPGGMTLARAVIPLTGPQEFERLLDEGAMLEEEGPDRVLQLLAETLAERAPMTWRRVFTLVGALDGAPCPVIESVLDNDDRPALDWLQGIRLIEERDGRLTVLPVLRDFAGAALESNDCDELLRRTAHFLLARVNDPASLDPVHADSVFRAHTLFVRGGDFTNARRTATLHTAGLIELAKRTSLERDYIEARRLYGCILELLEHRRVDSMTVHRKRTVSYVVHYRGFNDERSSDLHSPEALDDYRRSIELWHDNALWRQHEIEAFIARGDLRRAKQHIDDAYVHIDDHPRRDTILRARPARTAMRRGAPVFALEIIEGIEIPFDQDPAGAELLAQVYGDWSRKVSLSALPQTHGELLFRRPVRVSAQRRGHGWRAEIHDLHCDLGRGATALAALRNLADRLGDETGTLLSTPTHVLEDEQVTRKSELIAHVDPLNSDLGLRHATHRWLLGRIEDDSFVPLQRTDFDPISLPVEVRGDHPAHGEYMAKVPVFRDGMPNGPVEQLRPVGSGRSLQELMATLTELRQGAGE
jgi:hypothetical protein